MTYINPKDQKNYNPTPSPEFKEKQLIMLKRILKLKWDNLTPAQEADVIKICQDSNIIDALARIDYHKEMNRQLSLEDAFGERGHQV